jgi:hypothetical protein
VPQIDFFHRISFMRLENWPILYQLSFISEGGQAADLLAADGAAVVRKINPRIMSLDAFLVPSARSCLFPCHRIGPNSLSPLFSAAFLERCPARRGGKSHRHGRHQAVRCGEQPQYSTTTSATGQFAFGGIAPGNYTLSVSAAGKIWTAADSVVIKDGTTLGCNQVSSLPLNERDFSKLLLLAAGTMTDTNGAANFTQQFAVNGQRGSARLGPPD